MVGGNFHLLVQGELSLFYLPVMDKHFDLFLDLTFMLCSHT